MADSIEREKVAVKYVRFMTMEQYMKGYFSWEIKKPFVVPMELGGKVETFSVNTLTDAHNSLCLLYVFNQMLFLPTVSVSLPVKLSTKRL